MVNPCASSRRIGSHQAHGFTIGNPGHWGRNTNDPVGLADVGCTID